MVTDWRTLQLQALSGQQKPHLPAGEPEHLRYRWAAVQALAAGRIDDAINLLDEAEMATPELSGYLDGCEFDGWRDTDDLLGPTLEVIESRRYCWVPFEAIAVLSISSDDGELLTVELRLADGRELAGFVPRCYLGSETDERPEIRSGEATDWHTPHDGAVRGLGERVWLFGDAEIPISECQRIEQACGRISLI